MMTARTRLHRLTVVLLVLVLASACSEGHASQKEKREATSVPSSTGCDKELWKRVYNPSRLDIVKDCITAMGVIEEIGPDDDGDTHMLLKLDAGQENLINKRNRKKKAGSLVVEVVCSNPPTRKAAKKSCGGYHATIQLPKVGDHVAVTGSYVIDTHNGWAEIHPASTIAKR